MFKCGKKIQCKTISSFCTLIDQANSGRRLSQINQSSLLCNFKFIKRGQLLFLKLPIAAKSIILRSENHLKKKTYRTSQCEIIYFF